MRRPLVAFVVAFALGVAIACAGSPPTPCTECAGKCVDLKTDSANCGACNTACSGGQVCNIGSCSVTCRTGTTNCSGGCVDEQTDPAHCGDCTHACAAGQKCSSGACVGACRSSQTDCSGA